MMHTYRITIDAPNEQYLYEIEAKTRETAIDIGWHLARQDGYMTPNSFNTRCERLD